MEKLSTINRIRLESFVRSLSGQIFTVNFVKKNGETRVMNARLGVKKGVKGTGRPNGLATSCVKVFDMQKQAFRQINLETVRWVRTGGIKFLVAG